MNFQKEGCKKGFFFSVIAISFMLLLMFLAVTMSNEGWIENTNDNNAEKIKYNAYIVFGNSVEGNAFISSSASGATTESRDFVESYLSSSVGVKIITVGSSNPLPVGTYSGSLVVNISPQS